MNTSVSFDFLEGIDHPVSDKRHYEERGDSWNYNDSGFANYCSYAPAGTENRIRAALGSFANNVALDIAGGKNGQALQDLLDEGVIETGIVTNFADQRDDRIRNNPQLIHIEGDIIKPETWQAILNARERYAPEGFSLVMFRPIAALEGFPPKFYTGAAGLILDNLRPGGALLSQVPPCMDIDGPDRESICDYVHDRPDVSGAFAPQNFRVRPTALIVKK